MDLSVREVLARITTVPDMIRAFQDESHCRRLLEAMVWPKARICPACGYRRSIALTSWENGKRARSGLYQCSSGICRFQFTVTTRTPLHATKLPLRRGSCRENRAHAGEHLEHRTGPAAANDRNSPFGSAGNPVIVEVGRL